MGSGLPKPIGIGSLDQRIRALEERLKLMDGARRLAAATISEGGLTVVDGGGVTISGGGSLQWMDSQGRLRMEMREGAQTGAPNLLYMGESGAAKLVFGSMFIDGEASGEGLLVNDDEGNNIFVVRDGRTLLGGTNNATIEAYNSININAGGTAFINTGGQLQLNSDESMFLSADNSINLSADNRFSLATSNNSHRIQSTGNDVGIDAPNRLYVGANLYADGYINASGTKNFAIPHPTREGRALLHAATESPVAGIEYTGTATLDTLGEAVVDLPEYFEALAAEDSRTVHLTPVGRPFAVGADPVIEGQFTAYGEPGRSVSWLVKARRGDAAGQFDPEPLIEDSPMAPPEEEA